MFKKFENETYKGLITVTNIDFYSLCEHHLLPLSEAF
ncbi:GTP cyclohydrolase I [Candidatus Roizmanbacteria bacterium]|nr:GTP cyclohydrolase I [Candidatus Roizmanbacteria bacterium]